MKKSLVALALAALAGVSGCAVYPAPVTVSAGGVIGPPPPRPVYVAPGYRYHGGYYGRPHWHGGPHRPWGYRGW
jgi:hypothetical protein